MRRGVIWAAVIIASSAAVVGAASAWLARSACRAATANGTIRDFHEFTATRLDQDVRMRLPLGSPRAFVEGFLTGEGMKFNYDPSVNAILANAPCLKGSGIVVKSLGFTLRFDRDSKLRSIESHVHLTGP